LTGIVLIAITITASYHPAVQATKRSVVETFIF